MGESCLVGVKRVHGFTHTKKTLGIDGSNKVKVESYSVHRCEKKRGKIKLGKLKSKES